MNRSLAAVLFCLSALPLGAQSSIVDAGVFSVTRNGNPAGKESFRIVREQTGPRVTLKAFATRSDGSTITESQTTTDTAGSTQLASVTVRERGEATLLLEARAVSGTLSLMGENRNKERALKDFLVEGRTVILDNDLVHSYHFLAVGESATVSLIDLRARRQVSVSLRQVGLEPLLVGGTTLTAKHWSLGSGDSRRDWWTDNQGRLLKVEVAALQIVATRDEPPR